MWIITEHGFFTFVTDRKDPSMVWLRARVREDLERNFPGVEVVEKPGADYLYRAKVPRTLVAERMAQMVMDSNITSHFKDVALAKAPKQGLGDRRSAYYGLWSALARLQPYAPYSRVPRGQEPKVTWGGGWKDRRPGTGQTTLPTSGGSGRYASDFDWDARDWGGKSAADPVFSGRTGEILDPEDMTDISDEEWARMSEEEQRDYLDALEALTRQAEVTEDFGAAVRAEEAREAGQMAYPAPRNRPGSRKAKKNRKRRWNRHNQEHVLDIPHDSEEARNRATYLARKAQRKQG
jgi:hypothetical protein